MRYLYADDRIIRPKQDREINIPNEYFSFTLNAADYAALRKGVSVLGLPEIAIVGDGQRLSLRALDARNKTADVFDLVIGETNKNFKAVIPAENLKDCSAGLPSAHFRQGYCVFEVYRRLDGILDLSLKPRVQNF